MTPQPESLSVVEVERARAFLARCEVGRIEVDGQTLIGIWSYLDSGTVRGALKAVGWHEPVVYLDSPAVPDHYKGSRLPGEPVPQVILRAMEAAVAEPWVVRDEMLAGTHTYNSWEEWQREQRRRIFANKAAPPAPSVQPPAIERKTIAHGYAVYTHWCRWDPSAAHVHRDLHQNDETGWLLELGAGAEGHKLKLLLGRLEQGLEQVREAIRKHRDREAANQRFIATFRSELEHARAHPSGGLELSYVALRRLLLVLKRLQQEIEDEGVLSSLFT
jgi:hypothetical protein